MWYNTPGSIEFAGDHSMDSEVGENAGSRRWKQLSRTLPSRWAPTVMVKRENFKAKGVYFFEPRM